MDNNQQNIPEEDDLIERYLEDQLTSTEKEAFTTLLLKDEALQQRVNDMKLISIGIQEAALRSKLNEYHGQAPIVKRQFQFRKQWLVAAALIGLLALPVAWLLLRQNKSERLYTEFYRPDPGLMTSMAPSDHYVFEKAMIDYKTGNYEKALVAWKELNAVRANDTLHYFMASSYLALKQPDLAIPLFKKVVAMEKSAFKEDAFWYLGLALLQNASPEAAAAYIKQSNRKEKEFIISKLLQ